VDLNYLDRDSKHLLRDGNIFFYGDPELLCQVAEVAEGLPEQRCGLAPGARSARREGCRFLVPQTSPLLEGRAMLFSALFLCLSWVSRGTGEAPRRRPQAKPPVLRRPLRLRLDQLEDRMLPSNYTALTASDLIADINAANNAGGTNTITLTAPTTSPYVLTAVDNHTDGPTGLPVISGGTKTVAADNLTIIGNGDTVERSTTSGTPDFRLFDVASGASLTLNNLTLQNGYELGTGSSTEGGAIYNQGTLVLSAVTVQNNEADGINGKNGTRAHHNGFAGADAAGGGIWSSGSLTCENGTVIQNNQTSGGNGGNAYGVKGAYGGNGGNAFGGGVYIASGTANLSGTTLSGNVALGGLGGGASVIGVPLGGTGGNGEGGGVYVAGCSPTLSGDTIQNNTALGNSAGYFSDTPGDGLGGGICVAGGSATLSNNTLQSNSATIEFSFGSGAGGGIYVAGGSATLGNDIIESNSAGEPYGVFGSGGGLAVASGATLSLSGDTVNSNTATDGGGLYVGGGGVTLIGVTVDSNNALGYPIGSLTTFQGGGLCVDGGTVTLSSDTVEFNKAATAPTAPSP
jgi:hypothetical protein